MTFRKSVSITWFRIYISNKLIHDIYVITLTYSSAQNTTLDACDYTGIAIDEVDKFLVDFSFNDLKLDIYGRYRGGYF